jgi:hypothetical protein
MHHAEELVDAAVEEAVGLPSNPTFRKWAQAHGAGVVDEEAVKRAFRSVWWALATGRFDDFMQLLDRAETRAAQLRADDLVGWAQAAAARAALELMWSRRLDSPGAQVQRMKAGNIASAALRFARMARSMRTGRPTQQASSRTSAHSPMRPE